LYCDKNDANLCEKVIFIKKDLKLPDLISRSIVIPVFDLYRGTGCVEYLDRLKKSQWLPRDGILLLQNEYLGRIINHAYDHVLYYRRIFEERGLKPQDIRSAEDLRKLPVLTKSKVREYLGVLRATGFPDKKLFINSTSGSTGEPLQFYSTYDDFYNWGFAAAYRAYEWAGFDMGVKNIWIRGNFKYESAIRKYIAEFLQTLEKTRIIDPVSLSRTELSRLVGILGKFQPSVIRGYSSAISILAGYIEGELHSSFKLRSIISTGEQLYGYQRNLCSRIFECDVYNHYGAMEVRAIATECSEHHGLHIAAENVIVEVVDERGMPLPAGQEGKILVTNLHNYAMPLIRYEIGDLGVLSDESCPCGRGLPLLTGLNGRTSDVIVTPGGKLLSGAALIDISADLRGVSQYQIVQEDTKNIAVNIVPEKKYSDTERTEIMNGIIDRYRNVLGHGMEITVNFTNRIETTQIGKRKFVISSLKSHYNAV